MARKDQEYRGLFAELNRVITDKAAAATQARTDLRDAVCGYVAVEKARGTSLASIIDTVNSILERAEERPVIGEATTNGDSGLAKRLVAWCLEFRGGEAAQIT